MTPRELFKEKRGTLILSFVLILLPIFVGLYLWPQLPDQVPIHFDVQGQPDNYAPKALAVLGLPAFVAAAQGLLLAVTLADPKRANLTPKIVGLFLWICPLTSLLCGFMTYAKALGMGVDVNLAAGLFLGVLFLVIGNYLPKCKQTYTVGIRLPWTLADPDNWAYTHRLAGKTWTIAGLAALVCTAARAPWVMLWVVAGMVLIPIVASYVYALRRSRG